MSLTSVAMTFGNGLRVTDSLGGCISFGQALIGTDSRFRGPQFTIAFRLKLISSATTSGGCKVGIADLNGTARRQYLDVTVSGASFHLLPILDTTACGFQIVTDVTKTKDTIEHSVAWTYDQAGSWHLYWDGVEVDTGPATCADISGPSAASDLFTVWGSDTPGSELFYIDNVGYTNAIASAAQIAAIHSGGL